MIATYTTRHAAKKASQNLTGWKIKITRMYFGHNVCITDKNGYRYAINCNGTKHLQTDGYIN